MAVFVVVPVPEPEENCQIFYVRWMKKCAVLSFPLRADFPFTPCIATPMCSISWACTCTHRVCDPVCCRCISALPPSFRSRYNHRPFRFTPSVLATTCYHSYSSCLDSCCSFFLVYPLREMQSFSIHFVLKFKSGFLRKAGAALVHSHTLGKFVKPSGGSIPRTVE